MDDNNTIKTTTTPNSPEDNFPDADSQDDGSSDSNYPYSPRNRKIPPYSTNTMKNHKKKEHKDDDKLKIYTPPSPNAPNTDTTNDSTQDYGSTNSYLPYSLRNRKIPPCSTNTTNNQKNKEKKIDNKVTIDTNPAPNAPGDDTPNISYQDDGSIDSNYPYSLRNRKFAPYSTNTIKNQKKEENKIDDKDTFENPWPRCTQCWYPQ